MLFSCGNSSQLKRVEVLEGRRMNNSVGKTMRKGYDGEGRGTDAQFPSQV